jgi:hypothetical protein
VIGGAGIAGAGIAGAGIEGAGIEGAGIEGAGIEGAGIDLALPVTAEQTRSAAVSESVILRCSRCAALRRMKRVCVKHANAKSSAFA